MFSPPVRQFIARSIKIILTLIVLYFVYRQIASQWSEIKAYDWSIHWGYLLLSIATGLATFALLALLWRGIIASFGHSLSFLESYRIFYLSSLGRYVPGKVWQLFGILYLAGRKGIPADRATASFLAVQMFVIPSSFLVFAACALIRSEIIPRGIALFSGAGTWLMALGVLAVSTVVVVWPGLVFRGADWILQRFRPGRTLGFSMPVSTSLTLFLGYIVAWIGYGVSSWLGMLAVTGGGSIDAIPAIGAFNGAYQIGYLALFAPGGLGPREYILTLMLTPLVGAIAPAIAVLTRLWSILVEGIAALIALAVGK